MSSNVKKKINSTFENFRPTQILSMNETGDIIIEIPSAQKKPSKELLFEENRLLVLATDECEY